MSGSNDHEHITDYQIGWCVNEGAVEKWRRLRPIWFDVELDTQATLFAHYSTLGYLPDTQRAAVEGALGEFAAVAVMVVEEDALGRLIEACVDKGKSGRNGIIKAAVKRAEERIRQAHRVWYAFRELRYAKSA